MAQRNPMNQRYAGDGPGGQTRKSATSAKPVTNAASTVHVKKKPTTAAEKKAARKQREKIEARKAEEKRLKQEQLEKEQRLADEQAGAPKKKKEGFFSSMRGTYSELNKNEEYRKWRRIYWIMLIVGMISVVVSLVYNYVITFEGITPLFIGLMVVSYGCIIGALVVDFTKVKPFQRAQKGGSLNKTKTPKQLKHEQEKAAEAKRVEEARKAAKQARRLPLRRRTTAAKEEDS